jgi:hypothetical protein
MINSAICFRAIVPLIDGDLPAVYMVHETWNDSFVPSVLAAEVLIALGV